MNDRIRKHNELVRRSSNYLNQAPTPSVAATPKVDPADHRPWNGSVTSMMTGRTYTWTTYKSFREAIAQMGADHSAWSAEKNEEFNVSER